METAMDVGKSKFISLERSYLQLSSPIIHQFLTL